MADVAETIGIDEYFLGLKVVFWLYAVVVVLRVVETLGRAAASTAGYRRDAGEFLLLVLAIAVLAALFLGLCLAVFLFVSLHSVDVFLTSALGDGPASLLVESGGVDASRTVAIEPGVVFPTEMASLLYLLPPAVLVYAGYRARRQADAIPSAVVEVVTGYGVAALLTILPVVWLFNEIVVDLYESQFAPLADVTLAVRIPDLVGAHLLVILAYPLVFGTLGAVAGALALDQSRAGDEATDARGHPAGDTRGHPAGHNPQREPTDGTGAGSGAGGSPQRASSGGREMAGGERGGERGAANREQYGGHRGGQQRVDADPVCPDCGAVLEPGANYCSACGVRLR